MSLKNMNSGLLRSNLLLTILLTTLATAILAYLAKFLYCTIFATHSPK